MSNATYPCKGFVIELTESNIEALGITKKYVIEKMIERGILNGDEEVSESMKRPLRNLLVDIANYGDIEDRQIVINLPGTTFRVTSEIFDYSTVDGDEGDELCPDNPYLIFNEMDFYTKEVTTIGCAFSERNLMPEEKMWTNFG